MGYFRAAILDHQGGTGKLQQNYLSYAAVNSTRWAGNWKFGQAGHNNWDNDQLMPSILYSIYFMNNILFDDESLKKVMSKYDDE